LPAPGKFSVKNPADALARAESILATLKPAILFNSTWPLGEPVVRGHSRSAEIYFNESYSGKLLVPIGSVRIDLGPKGELVSFYSDYRGDLTVTNHARLRLIEIKRAVLDQASRAGQELPILGGGSPIIWVSGGNATFAYRLSTRTLEQTSDHLIVDAESGKIIVREGAPSDTPGSSPKQDTR
jgi:hypothetical protein